MRIGGRRVWSVALAVALVGCASAGASDVDDGGRPLTTRPATTSSTTSTTTSSTTSTAPPATTTTAPPSATTAPTPPGVDCNVAKCIALTFDDGPAPTTIPLLDILKAKDVPATFFMLGLQVDEFPEIVRRVQAEGHEIGNHTYDHKKLTAMAQDAAVDDVGRGAAAIAAVTGQLPTFVRPPQGATSDAVRGELGLPEILWSVDPEDWLTKDTDKTILRVAQGARPGRIILMHDIYDTSVAAVSPIIDILRSQGYTFVTITELLGSDLAPDQAYRERPTG